MPANRLYLERTAGKLSIAYRWRSRVAYFLIPFCLFWDGIALLFLFSGAGLMISLHLLTGALLTYYTICLLLNRTRITVDARAVSVEHGPVPWFTRGRHLDSGSVEQLFVEQFGQYKSGNRVTLLYRVVARLQGEKDIVLLSGLDDPQLADEVERGIEEFLQIDDRPVANALPQLELPEPLRRWLGKRLPPEVRQRMAAEPDRGLPSEDREIAGSAHAPEHVHAPHPTYSFALCHARVGERFLVADKSAELRAARVIDWTDGQEDTARTLRVVGRDGSEEWHFYACQVRGRWQYFEERELDGEEREVLGFTGSEPAGSFRNGDDRYYAHPPQRGQRDGVPVNQWIYTSSGATTRFRCLRGPGDRWEVYVQEPFDSGYFEGGG
ncbi:DUF2267 domain-containing protein [Lewinella sp. IMCC34183]|uniref:DUF2267 domain-containing protein n=1 Tax=Lewinella sp. IMCC34183 TaxID=2248762 RepID=UPI000E26E05A|nr:DUF2267 domain-containing protein [Lewinella sp. IMCC34183]